MTTDPHSILSNVDRNRSSGLQCFFDRPQTNFHRSLCFPNKKNFAPPASNQATGSSTDISGAGIDAVALQTRSSIFLTFSVPPTRIVVIFFQIKVIRKDEYPNSAAVFLWMFLRLT